MKRLQLIIICLLTMVQLVDARGRYDNTDTLFVAQDGSGDFQTIGEAVEACRAFMEYTKVIFVRQGIYYEKVVVPSWLTNIEIVGEDRDKTIITHDDHANLMWNEVRRTWCKDSFIAGDLSGASSLIAREKGISIGTFRTYTLKIEGSNITLRNITIENNAPQLGQAVALHTEGTHLHFVNCRFLGNQDTVYTGAAETMLRFDNCYIEGTTDFIFGPSTAWFEGCEIHSKTNSYITAASTPKEIQYGYIFYRCRLTADSNVDKVYLGRPWRAFAHTLFIECELGKHIAPEGWENWKDYHDPAAEGTVRYQEYNNHGEGASTSLRVAWSKQLSKKEAKKILKTSQWLRE